MFLQHGDLDPQDSKLEYVDGKATRLHVTYNVVGDKAIPSEENAEIRLHSTDGASHRYTPVEKVYNQTHSIQPVEKKAKK
jgi:hypothetical protein